MHIFILEYLAFLRRVSVDRQVAGKRREELPGGGYDMPDAHCTQVDYLSCQVVLGTQVVFFYTSFYLVKDKEALSALSRKVKVFGCKSSTKK